MDPMSERVSVISKDEYKALEAFAADHLGGILAMAYHTGMRKGEILGLTWDKVDLQKRMIYLDAADTKDKEPRKIPINRAESGSAGEGDHGHNWAHLPLKRLTVIQRWMTTT
jgi:integrase